MNAKSHSESRPAFCTRALIITVAILCAPLAWADFSGLYDPDNWLLTNTNADGWVDISGAPGAIALTGGNNGIPGESDFPGTTDYEVVVGTFSGCTVNVSFDWFYSTEDGPGFDPAGYLVNGVFNQLTESAGGNEQNGSVAVALSAGDVFGFRVATVDNVYGAGALSEISDFNVVQAPLCKGITSSSHDALDVEDENFESDLAGYTATDEGNASNTWHFNDACDANAASGYSQEGAARWGDPTACGSYGTDSLLDKETDVLDSTGFDVSACKSIALNFKYFLEYQEDYNGKDEWFDQAWVQVSFDGGANQTLADNGPIGGLMNEATWHTQSFPMLGNPGASTMQVRFIGATNDELFNSGQGFLVDDVEVSCTIEQLAVEVGTSQKTEYQFALTYDNEGGPDVIIEDTVPAEWAVTGIEDVQSLGCEDELANKGKKADKGATKIDCGPGFDSGSVLVNVETRQHGNGNDDTYRPGSCGALYLNNGAAAYDVTDLETPILVSNNLCLAAVEDLDGGGIDYSGMGDEDGDSLSDHEEACSIGTNPCTDDSDGDGVTDTVEVESSCMDPLKEDTDDDGLPDGQEDLNGDGIVDGNETDPCDAEAEA